MENLPAPLKSAEEDLRQFRDWYRNLVRKMLIFYSPVAILLAIFVVDENVPLKTWGLTYVIFAALFFLPISSSAALSLSMVSYFFIVPSSALETPGLGAFLWAQPPLLPIYAAVFGGPNFSAFFAFAVAVLYIVFTYLHSNNILLSTAVTPFGSALNQWLSGALVHCFVLPYSWNAMLEPLRVMHEETRRSQDASRRLEKATTRLRLSLGRYSHEIRTPLHILCAMADDLQSIPDSQHHGVHNDLILLKSSAHWLLAHANNVLDVCALEVQAVRVERAPFSTRSLVQSMSVAAQFAAQVRGVSFTSEISDDIPTLIVGDGPRLQQILRVLLSFIFQHVASGDVFLNAKRSGGAPAVSETSSARIVHRTSSGTSHASSSPPQSRTSSPAQWCDLLFSLSANLPHDWWRLGDQAGSSGLYVAEQLCAIMGGTFTVVHSRQVVTFEILLPFIVAPSTTQTSAVGLRVLYADDEPSNLFVLSSFLRGTPHHMDAVQDGEQAVAAVKQTPYDLILLDLDMPGLNGLEAARQMRDIELQRKERRKPILLLTAHVGTGLASLAADNGLDAVVAKPVSRARVLQVLDAVAAAASMDIPPEMTAPTPAPSARQKDLYGGSSSPSSDTETDELRSAATAASGLTLSRQPLDWSPKAVSRRLLLKLWRFVWSPNTEDPVQLWRYRGCLLIILMNLLLITVLGAIHLDHLGPLPLNLSAFAVATLCFATFTFLIRLTANKIILLLFVLPAQIFMVGYIMYVREQPIPVAVPFLLNVVTNLPFKYNIVSGVVVSVTGLLSVYARGVSFFATYVPKQEDVLGQFTFDLYILMTVGLFVVYQLLSRGHNLQMIETARREAVTHARLTLERKKAAERFVSSLSFDLRTPLNVVLAVAERLAELTELSNSTMRRINIIQSAAHLLLTLISNMVDVRALETMGKTQAASGDRSSAATRTIDVRECVRRIGRILVFYAHRKKLRLVVRVSKDVPSTVTGNPLRLQQILMNLISNAIRYTPKGDVTLYVDAINEMRFHELPPFALRSVDRTEMQIKPEPVRRKSTDTDTATTATTVSSVSGGTLDTSGSTAAAAGAESVAPADMAAAGVGGEKMDEFVGVGGKSAAAILAASQSAAAGAASAMPLPSSSGADTETLEMETSEGDDGRELHEDRLPSPDTKGLSPAADEAALLARKLSSGLNTPVAESAIQSGESGRVSPVMSRLHLSNIGTADVTNEPTRCFLRFRVVDSGIGIGEEAAKAVMAEVSNGDDLSVETIKGSGLRVTRAIVEELNGKLSVTSCRGVGTRVEVVLPTTLSLSNSPKQEDQMSLRPLRLLVIEDIPEMLYIMKLYLRDTPHECDTVHTGAQGLARYERVLAERDPYDVLVIDKFLPDMDGLEVVSAIRRLENEKQRRPAEVVVMSASVSSAVEEEVRQAGVKFFEPKPLTRQRLLQVLWQIATQRTPPASPRVAGMNTAETAGYIGQLFTQTGASLALNASTMSGFPAVDEQPQWIARVDSTIYSAVEKEFLPRTRERLQRLPALMVAEETSGDRAQLQKEAEAISAGAATYGLNTLAEAAENLSIACKDNPAAIPELLEKLITLTRTVWVQPV